VRVPGRARRAVRVVRALGPIDALSVRRDALLRWVLVLPLLVALAARWVLPGLLTRAGALLQRDARDLLPLYAPLVGVELLLFAPALAGMVVGFLLLDLRDDRTLAALQVTPLPLPWYLAYRLASPVVLSVALTLVLFPLAGITALGAGALLVAVAAAPLAPLLALALGAFAENKVQGFALVKGLGVVLPAPLLVYFVDAPWTAVFAVVPTYWPARLYWALLAGTPDAGLYLVGGLVYQGLLLVILLRRFDAAVHRTAA
jgi:fluoroquinolone transport system permease protein